VVEAKKSELSEKQEAGSEFHLFVRGGIHEEQRQTVEFNCKSLSQGSMGGYHTGLDFCQLMKSARPQFVTWRVQCRTLRWNVGKARFMQLAAVRQGAFEDSRYDRAV
jgi:hypothetical protein